MRRGHRERGAALVEYALLVALFAIVATPAARFLGGSSSAKLHRVGEEIGPAAPVPPGSAGPGSGDGGSGGPGGPGTTTPAPSTTRPSPTAAATVGQPTAWAVGWTNWSGSAQVAVTGAGGAPLAGAMVRVRIHGPDVETATVTVTTAGDGAATVEVGPYSRWLWNVVDQVQVTVVAVEDPGGHTWDGRGTTTTISAPR